MYFVDNGSAVPVMPQVKPVSSATPQFFTEGGNGTPPTYPGPDWFNIFQLELLNVLKEAQINPDKANHTQLVTAMKKLFLDASSNGSDIPDKAAFLSNLGLSSGAPAIGIPFYWPSAALPNTVMPEWAGMVFLKHNGAAFSGVTYPKLALVYPGLVLPDTRGEFIRNWDDGRGVDSGRALLSAQAATGIGRYVGSDGADTIAGVDLPDSQYAGSASWSRVPITTSPRLGQTYNAVKPRSIAFNFIVRAA